jgi:RNA polymerase sigma factor (sigma-70 family)
VGTTLDGRGEGPAMMTDAELLHALARRDPAAVEAIVRRHGPLVLRVCRDVLGDPDDADDAFQATFLVLVRKAGSIRQPDALGRWLYGTAHRIAVRARVAARRRRARERGGMEVSAMAPAPVADDHHEVRPILHDELGRLPERLREPLVLCYMEGCRYEEAARRLEVPLGTLKARLGRGRELLRSRLARRGVAVSAVLLLLLLSERSEAVPAPLVASTRDACDLALRGGPALPETVPGRIARLADRELGARSLRRWTSAVLIVALAAILAHNIRPSARVAQAGAHVRHRVLVAPIGEEEAGSTCHALP